MSLKYVAPFFDPSGYGEAARGYLLAIDDAGYPVRAEATRHAPCAVELGRDRERIEALCARGGDYDKLLVHTTPDLWKRRLRDEPPSHRIGYTVWETSRLHPIWVRACDAVDEIWVPSRWNAEVFAASGVRRPVRVVPHAVRVPDLARVTPIEIPGVSSDDFVFYSIFHWQERKNPGGLLTAFLAAFSGVRDVVLVLKTYVDDVAADAARVARAIEQQKSTINLMHYPRVVAVVENWSPEQILRLHRRGDCFVLLQRGEGWGLPHSEAAACGNPVVTTGWGGQLEFLERESAHLVDFTMRPVTGMGWSGYLTGDQLWAEPDLSDAIDRMRDVYRNRERARDLGARAREGIRRRFTPERVGAAIVERLREIDGG